MNFGTKISLLVAAVALVGGLVVSALTWGGRVIDGVGEIIHSLGVVSSDEEVQIQAAAFELGQTIAAISHVIDAYAENMPNGPQPIEKLASKYQKDRDFVKKYTVILAEFSQLQSDMSTLSKELKLSAEVKLSSFNPVSYPLNIQSRGSQLAREEIRRRYGERAEEAFLLGLEIRGAFYQAQDKFFDYGLISTDGISGTSTYGGLADRARTFGAEARTGKEVQKHIDDIQLRWEKIAPAEQVANRGSEEAVVTTNRVLRIELNSLEYDLSEAISERRASNFAKNAFFMIVVGTLIVGAMVFIFRVREVKQSP